jgi:hypothetical protein
MVPGNKIYILLLQLKSTDNVVQIVKCILKIGFLVYLVTKVSCYHQEIGMKALS